MTAILAGETFSRPLDETAPADLDTELAELTMSTLPAERLGDNLTAQAVWNTMVPLLNGSDRAQQFSEHVPATPLLRVPEEALPADLQGGNHQLYLAADGYMPTGAYKFRGVMSALLEALEQDGEIRETVAASTGNHAAATALASTILGLDSVVYMPNQTVQSKIGNTAQYGANIRFVDDLAQAVQEAELHGQQSGSVFIHPYDRLAVVAGQGTLVANLPRQLSLHGVDLHSQPADLYEPAGGGGVATGNSVAAKVLLPNLRLHVAQAEDADALLAQLDNRAFDETTFNSAVDGAAVQNPGAIAQEVLSAPGFVHGQHVVSRAQVGEAMAVTSKFTDIYEPAGALALAAAIADMRQDPNDAGVKIAHGTGINTTPQKVHEFAGEAVRAGLLSEPEAFALVSLAHVDRRRRPTGVEERGLSLAARKASAAKQVRTGTQVLSGLQWPKS
jgi:threonine dehydratase